MEVNYFYLKILWCWWYGRIKTLFRKHLCSSTNERRTTPQSLCQ